MTENQQELKITFPFITANPNSIMHHDMLFVNDESQSDQEYKMIIAKMRVENMSDISEKMSSIASKFAGADFQYGAPVVYMFDNESFSLFQVDDENLVLDENELCVIIGAPHNFDHPALDKMPLNLYETKNAFESFTSSLAENLSDMGIARTIDTDNVKMLLRDAIEAENKRSKPKSFASGTRNFSCVNL